MRWSRVGILVAAALLVAAGLWFLVVKMEREVPALTFDAEPRFIGRGASLAFSAFDGKSGLRQVGVWISQGPERRPVLLEDFPAGGPGGSGRVHRRDVEVALDPQELGLEEGAAVLYVAAQDNSYWKFKGNSVFREFTVVVDTRPPRIDLLSTVHNVNRGGTGLVAYRVSEPPARSGVEIGERFFPGYQEPAGGDQAYVAYFAVPTDATSGTRISLTARDEAGNEARRTFPTRILEKRFRRDAVTVSEGFLEAKIPEFRSLDPSLPEKPIDAYIVVNREWRKRDHKRFRELCATSEPARLWAGAFLQMENTKNMSAFGDRRSYVYRGKVVDKETHLGIDLASTGGAPVPAANGGVVAFAGEIGIYGQTVLVDHGQGLFSSYSHLSGISVAQGDRVDRGGTLGTSGRTGLAGGDHLHFGVLVSGEFVNPLEWLDGHWIENNVENKLELLVTAPR